MKKSLLAVAVAAALPAFAQAQTSVTMYGSLDASLEYVNTRANAGGPSNLRMTNGVWSGSRLGVRGTEDIGGGLKGVFQIEHRFNVDDGNLNAARFWNGNAYVGLAGGFGELRMGRQYTPNFWALIGADLTGYSWYNNSLGMYNPATGLLNVSMTGSAFRADNQFQYWSPTIGGLQLIASYSPGYDCPPVNPGGTTNAAGANCDTTVPASGRSDNDFMSLAGTFKAGGLYVGLGYERFKIVNGNNNSYMVSAAYNFGAFGVGAAYGIDDPEVGGKIKKAFLNANAKVGPGDVYLTVSRVDVDNAAFDASLGFGLTFAYNLSKRTFPYVALGIAKVDGENPKQAAIGIRHFF